MKSLKSFLAGAAFGPMLAAEQRVTTDIVSQIPYPKRGFTFAELSKAYGRLMTGPKATRPTGRAVRKVIGRMRAGLSTTGPWRSWPAIKGDVL